MLVFENFSSIESFRAALNSRPVNPHGAREQASHDTRDVKFYCTPDWETAERLMHNGDDESAALLEHYTANSQDYAQRPQNIIERRESGFSPCVPAYLAGSPRAMFNKRTIQQPRRGAVNIAYLISASSSTTRAEMAQAGAIILNIINALQTRGESVNLYILPLGAERDGDNFICSVRVLHAGQRVNIERLAYMLINPSFLRRHGFRWLETAPEIKRFISGYGAPINAAECREALESKPDLRDYKLVSFKDIRASNYDIIKTAAALGVTIK